MDKRQRAVAFLHEDFPLGGAERVTIQLAPYLESRGYAVHVYARLLHPELWPTGTEKRLQPHLLPDSSSLNSSRNTAYLAAELRERGVGTFVSVCNGFLAFDPLRNACPGCSFLFAMHGKPLWEVADKEQRLLRKREKTGGRLKWLFLDFLKYKVFRLHYKHFLKLHRKLYEKTDAYVVLCEPYKREMARLLRLEGGTRLHAIGNAVSTPSHPLPEKEKQILFAGRMTYADKRIDRLLRIWARVEQALPDWRLVLTGDGPERPALEQTTCRLGLKRASFAGYRQDLTPLYEQSAVVCLTSSFEGWPLCLAEGQAYGAVPMAFGCSEGIKAICGGGECGLLVEPFDEDAYAEALIALLRDEPRLKVLRQKTLQKAQDYSIERIGAQWVELIRSLQKEKKHDLNP